VKLNGKVVLLTGAGSGIGRALTLALHKQGCKLAVMDWKADGLNETLLSIPNSEESIFAETFDVSDRQSFETFANNTIDKFGGIDVLINNAGVSLGLYQTDEVKDEDLDWVLDINLKAPINATRFLLPHFKSRPESYIVFLSSVFGLAGIAGQFPYCVSKFGIRGFGESLRMELADSNVNILNIHPGGVKTNIVRYGRYKEEQGKELISNFDEKLAKTSATEAARLIVNALQKNKERLLIGNDAGMLDKLVRLLPAKYSRILFKVMRKTGNEITSKADE